MSKKYKLLKNDSITIGAHTLYRIQALRNFNKVKKGDIGGYIEKEENLSHKGSCWVYDNAKVFEDAKVVGHAKVYGNAIIEEKAILVDNVEVSGNARVYGHAVITDSVIISNNSLVHGNATIGDTAFIMGNVHILDNASIRGNAHISGNAHIYENAYIGCKCVITDNAVINGYAHLDGNAFIHGSSYINGYAHLSTAASIENNEYVTVGPIGSREDYTTFYLNYFGDIMVSCGCFNGNIDKFSKIVHITHSSNPSYRRQYKEAMRFANKILKPYIKERKRNNVFK